DLGFARRGESSGADEEDEKGHPSPGFQHGESSVGDGRCSAASDRVTISSGDIMPQREEKKPDESERVRARPTLTGILLWDEQEMRYGRSEADQLKSHMPCGMSEEV